MVKLTGDAGEIRRQSFRGRFYIRVSRGQVIMSAWPKKRPGPMSDKQAYAVDKFKQAAVATKYMDPADQNYARELTKGTNALPRDLLMMALYGRLGTVYLEGGERIYSLASMQNSSGVLDPLGYTKGMVLVRGDTYWAGIPIGAEKDVLTVGPDGLPIWATPSGGGAGWWFSPPDSTSFTLYSSDATDLSLTDDQDAGLLVACGPQVGGNKKRVAFYDIPDPDADWSLKVRLQVFIDPTNYSELGILCQRSANSRITGTLLANQHKITFLDFPGLTGLNGTISEVSGNWPFYWLGLSKVGTNLTASLSPDGKQWQVFGTKAIATYMGGNPDRIGFGVNSINTSGLDNMAALQGWFFEQ